MSHRFSRRAPDNFSGAAGTADGGSVTSSQGALINIMSNNAGDGGNASSGNSSPTDGSSSTTTDSTSQDVSSERSAYRSSQGDIVSSDKSHIGDGLEDIVDIALGRPRSGLSGLFR